MRETKFHFHPADATSYERPGATVLSFVGELSIAQLPKGDYRADAQASGTPMAPARLYDINGWGLVPATPWSRPVRFSAMDAYQ
jgi:hypothetical protein